MNSEQRGVPGHPFLLELKGHSMEPTLRRGSRVLIEPLTSVPSLGEVVAIQGQDGLIVHRVIHAAGLRAGRRVYHAGDATGALGRCAQDAVIGRVVAVVGPEDARTADLEPISAATRRRLRWARWRCQAEAAIRAFVG